MSPKVKKEVPDEVEAHVISSVEKPKPSDPEWNSYVLSLLTEEELVEGKYPTTDGLRRVAEILMGEMNIDVKTTQSPGSHNGMVATAECLIELLTIPKYIREVADATPENTEFPYSRHLTAVAGTRAEGRALRKFLRLRKIITAEEANTEGAQIDASQKMNQGQAKMIDFMAKKFNFDGWKLVNHLLAEREPNKKYNSLNEISYDFTVSTIMPECQKFQQKDKEGNLNQVPAEFEGYDSNLLNERWKS